jgi:hypothetical protein
MFNSNPSEQKDIDKIIDDYIEQNVASSEYNDYVVTEEQVVKAVKLLKAGKSDGDKSFMSDHIINGPRMLWIIIAILLTTSRKHGHTPEDLCIATIASIPKDKCGNMCSADNYRGIALCSSLGKLNDMIILTKYKDLLASSDMQYAFKEKHGTTMCSLVVKDVVKYYWRKGTEVYSCFVDASKAFDKSSMTCCFFS